MSSFRNLCVSEVSGDVKEPELLISKGENVFINYENKEIYEDLIRCKRKIGNEKYKKNWEKTKKRTNLYELIHTTHSNKNMSVADHVPLSRSYFKMWEMLKEYKLLDKKTSIITAHLAEGPGGFIEAVKYYRKGYMDYMYGITLRSTDGDVPGWNSSRKFLKKNRNVEICYGSDGTGNLYNINNILHFASVTGRNNVELVTADGGFDFSTDFNNQERMFYRLFLCEVVTALSIQKKGGTFICKIFDIFHKFTYDILYILYSLYDELIIDKPNTSRPANSEKYIIARGFRGISNIFLKQLQDIVLLWDNNITSIIGTPISKELIKQITKYNKIFINKQIININKTLDKIENKYTVRDLEETRKEQCIAAVNWCNKYEMRINRNCYVLKKFYNWRLLRKKVKK